MENLRSGDKILISGECGEDGIIARNWAMKFEYASLVDGNNGDILTNFVTKRDACLKTCPNCKYPLPDKEDRVLSIALYRFKNEELEKLDKEYDLIFRVEHNNGGFYPKLVGGKRYQPEV